MNIEEGKGGWYLRCKSDADRKRVGEIAEQFGIPIVYSGNGAPCAAGPIKNKKTVEQIRRALNGRPPQRERTRRY